MPTTEKTKTTLWLGSTWQSWLIYFVLGLTFQHTIPHGNDFPWWLVIWGVLAVLVPKKMTFREFV